MKLLALIFAGVCLGGLVGCQSGVAPMEILESQTPPAVQSAWIDHHKNVVIQKVTTVPMNGQPTYRFEYKDDKGNPHVTVYNVGGDEIESTN